MDARVQRPQRQWNRPLARGCHTRGTKRKPTPGSCRLCVDFPMDMFCHVRDFAEREETSMNEAVRTFVMWGIESAGGELED